MSISRNTIAIRLHQRDMAHYVISLGSAAALILAGPVLPI